MAKAKTYVDIRGYHSGVTGSCIRNTVHFANGEEYRFLVDYGMYQGENHKPLEFNDSVNPEKIDSVLLTHTHLDHDGALPAFAKMGYRGPIYMSEASATVIDIGLQDSYNVMIKDAKNKKIQPIYSSSDIDVCKSLIVPVKYGKKIEKINTKNYFGTIDVTFFGNGHLVGASMILVHITDANCDEINLLYTGDYKPDNDFLDLKPLPYWVYALPNLTIITEATYGSTNSSDITYTWEEDIIKACAENRIILNTAFAQGRFQELLYRIRKLEDLGKIPKDYPVKVDGATGITYTFKYLTYSNILGIKSDMLNIFPYNLQFVDNKSRSNILSSDERKIIISTAGMGSHGPAATYIKYFLSNPWAMIYFPGYTAEGTLGRKVFEADYDQEILFKEGGSAIKRATVLQTSEFSSHAKADEIIALIKMFDPRSVLINHGTFEAKEKLRQNIIKETGITKTHILGMGYVYRVTPYGIEACVEK